MRFCPSSCACARTNDQARVRITINGKHSTTIAYADELEKCVIGQLTALCNQAFVQGQKLRVMPDAHAGAGCVIGTTMTIADRIVSTLVGVDIGCGMETINIGKSKIDFKKLDKIIRENVPG